MLLQLAMKDREVWSSPANRRSLMR